MTRSRLQDNFASQRMSLMPRRRGGPAFAAAAAYRDPRLGLIRNSRSISAFADGRPHLSLAQLNYGHSSSDANQLRNRDEYLARYGCDHEYHHRHRPQGRYYPPSLDSITDGIHGLDLVHDPCPTRLPRGLDIFHRPRLPPFPTRTPRHYYGSNMPRAGTLGWEAVVRAGLDPNYPRALHRAVGRHVSDTYAAPQRHPAVGSMSMDEYLDADDGGYGYGEELDAGAYGGYDDEDYGYDSDQTYATDSAFDGGDRRGRRGVRGHHGSGRAYYE